MILITGASGQLGGALASALRASGTPHLAVGRPQFDFALPGSVAACLTQARPSLVINAAAYTAVDKAEAEPEAAEAGNHTGPAALAGLCAQRGIPLIHISTDYVFDGRKGAPYVEDDPTSPAGVYGASKRRGEEAVLASGARAVILRTAWVYAQEGRNFARTMLAAGRKSPRLRVVADQRGTPTAAPDLARAVLAVAARIAAWEPRYGGVFHATSAGETSWHGFAEAIFAHAATRGYPAPEVAAITTADWPTPARRPADSRLDCGKLGRVFGITLPHWQERLPEVVDAILRAG